MGHPDLRYKNLEDWPFAIKLIKKKIPLVLIDKELCFYRITAGSLSMAKKDTAYVKGCAKVMRNFSIPMMLRHGWLEDAKKVINDAFFYK
jgi:hypothetical protein